MLTIASTFAAPVDKPEMIVDELATANGVDAASIVPGQTLVVSAGS